MSAIAERFVKVFAKLPPAELREVWQRVGVPPENRVPARTADERATLEAAHSLNGRFAGGNMLVHSPPARSKEK